MFYLKFLWLQFGGRSLQHRPSTGVLSVYENEMRGLRPDWRLWCSARPLRALLGPALPADSPPHEGHRVACGLLGQKRGKEPKECLGSL